MTTFQVSLVSPEKLLFSGHVDQVDLPGVEGDLGILAGHAPIVTVLRPGIVTTMTAGASESFVVLGGVAEFSNADELTILAELASSVEEFDLAEFRAQIEQMQEDLAKHSIGDELDHAIAKIDHYKSIQTSLAPATAF